MNHTLLTLLLVATLGLPALAGAVTEEDFETQTTRNLLNLCTASATDPRYREAIHFCHGYLVGAFDYHMTANAGPDSKPLVCPPTPMPSRNTAVGMFTAWVQAHPQYLGERPVETEFRFLSEQWPCQQ